MNEFIEIIGAKENNLKNISLKIPKNKINVLTGVSGSGKSTIAFEILQKECQRQYMESMGVVTDYISKPKITAISGLSPSISIDQHNSNKNPRSTVGTVTEVFTYLRILFAKLGTRICQHCGKPIIPSFEDISSDDFDVWDGELDEAQESGKDDSEFAYGKMLLCPHCNSKMAELTMSNFSFNKPEGMCPVCNGIGKVSSPDIDLVIDRSKSIWDGAVIDWDDFHIKRYSEALEGAAKYYGFEFDSRKPLNTYEEVQMDAVLYGVLSPQFRKHYPKVKPPKTVVEGRFEGVITNLMRRYQEHAQESKGRAKIEKVLIQKSCSACDGKRLKKESREVTVGGMNIIELSQVPLYRVDEWIKGLPEFVSEKGLTIAQPIIDDLQERVKRLLDVGVGYLSMERSAPTLSAGEAQRLRLASLLGSGLTGVLYVLDEPTTGLHARDTKKLINVLTKLRDMGNTIVVIEHDTELMRAADNIIDIGPYAGKNGGEVIANGKPEEIVKADRSITAKYIYKDESSVVTNIKRTGNGKFIEIVNAYEHNLKHVNVKFPLGEFISVTGVSGSGKSTLMFDVFDLAARQYFNQSEEVPGKHEKIIGLENINSIITINQSAIGRTTRSNAATYTDVFTNIRNLYANLAPKKLEAKHFSFNVPGGRCEKCQGAGVLSIPMHFLPDVQVKCPSCHGKRFKKNILEVKYNGYSISDVLNKTIDEAYEIFKEESSIAEKLQLMQEVGLGYLQLGQPATTLSGGEAQRIKLAKELSKKGNGHVLYLLDEPTTGLHPSDVEKLVTVLMKLVDQGNTVIVIEHNVQVIASSDYVIDFGPEGGEAGGEIIACGTPLELTKVENSKTGKAILEFMNK